MPSKVFSRCNLKALIYLLPSQHVFLVTLSSSFFQTAEGNIAEQIEQCITLFSLLFSFVFNAVFVVSTVPILLHSTVVLSSPENITTARNSFKELLILVPTKQLTILAKYLHVRNA